MSSPLDPSQLIFSTAHTSINSALTSLKRSNLSVTNRLHSIKHDADFVQKVAETLQLPLIANERCGSWYIPPSQKAGSAYFKSTDGHHGQWSFSLRRLNLQVVNVVGENGGCVIVDSTRRGKSMPDALSKTVPIWIAVLNRLLFPDRSEVHALQTPENVVSRSEHEQIEECLSEFVTSLRGLVLDIDGLRRQLKDKPLEAAWVTPETELPSASQSQAHTNMIALCTASGRFVSSILHPSNYVQGAADDSESWANGLDAETFWANSDELLMTAEDDISVLIATFLARSQENVVRKPVLIKPTSNIWIGNNSAAEVMHLDFDLVIFCSEIPSHDIPEKLRHRCVHLNCTTGKIGSRQLRSELPKLESLAKASASASRILVTCQTGKDIAVGVALAVICLSCDEKGAPRPANAATEPIALNKANIKHRLSWIMVSMPDAAPSRATLQSVNSFLLG